MLRQTHTYAVLEVSSSAYQEIRLKLQAARYQHAFQHNSKNEEVIDMHGIAIVEIEKIQRPIADEAHNPNTGFHG